MSFKINEEHVRPHVVSGWARLDSRQADLVTVERFEQAEQRACLVVCIGNDGCLVVASRFARHGTSHDKKTGGVVASILNAGMPNMKPIQPGCILSGNGCRRRIVGGQAGSLRVTADVRQFDIRVMSAQPQTTLAQRLSMRHDATDLTDSLR